MSWTAIAFPASRASTKPLRMISRNADVPPGVNDYRAGNEYYPAAFSLYLAHQLSDLTGGSLNATLR